MNAQCCICSELFVIDPSVSIAAVQCGHTFHEGCLSTWLKKSNTCPSCRSRVNPSRVINHLFFDGDDDNGNDGTEDWKLKTKVKCLKEKLKTVKKERDLSELKVIDLEQKFSQYQNIEKLLTESEVDIKENIQQYGESKESVQELATYCSVLKRKYDKIKSEKKNVKSEFEKFKRENMFKDDILQEKEREITLLNEKLAKSEENLKKVGKKKQSLKRKKSWK